MPRGKLSGARMGVTMGGWMGGASGLLIRRSHQLHYDCQGLEKSFSKILENFRTKDGDKGLGPPVICLVKN